MHLRPHPDSMPLEAAVDRCLPLATPWAGDAFRMAEAPYATQADILSGQGAAFRGQRWNPPGILAIYACLSADLAMIEWAAQRRKAGILNRRHLPLTQITIIAKLQHVLDFRNPALVSALGLPMEPFLIEPHTAQNEGDPELRAQAFGRMAASRLVEAMIVPSAQNAVRFNLVIYRANLSSGSTIEIHGKEFLLPA
jgi:RES domain-containing protein